MVQRELHQACQVARRVIVLNCELAVKHRLQGQETLTFRTGDRKDEVPMGFPSDLDSLRGYGNAIVPSLAAEFITAYMNARGGDTNDK